MEMGDWIFEYLKGNNPDINDVIFDGLDWSDISNEPLSVEKYIPKTSADYPKLKSIPSVKDNSWKRLFQELMGEINPQELYHGGSNIFDKFDLSKAGRHGLNSGTGAYLTNNPVFASQYGDKLSKFYLNKAANLINEGNALNMLDPDDIPWFTKHDDYSTTSIDKLAQQDRYNKYLKQKGYSGYKNNMGWKSKPTYEYVIFDENELKPANTLAQRLMNRIPTQTLGRMYSKTAPYIGKSLNLANRLATPLMVLEGLSSPTSTDEQERAMTQQYLNEMMQPSLVLLQGGVQYNRYLK